MLGVQIFPQCQGQLQGDKVGYQVVGFQIALYLPAYETITT